MAPLCAVCESPTAHTLHFGGRCCKACAAFFRRTVALDLKYECASDEPCEIHFSMRLVCRECRLAKCYTAGMKPALVRSKRENFICTRRKDSSTATTGRQQGNSPYTRYSMSPEDNDWSCPFFELKNNSPPMNSTTAINTPPVNNESMISRASSFDAGYCSPHPSSSQMCPPIPPTVYEPNQILTLYTSIETSLNSKRRIMYTDTHMDYILDRHESLQCPYTPADLRPHDYRHFRGMLRHDFAMLFDYSTRYPEFGTLTTHEKNMFYRYLVAVDFIVSTAYYSFRLGEPHRQMILTNGEFLQMDPLPFTGQEPNARQYFESDDDFSKYRALMPLHIAIWEETVLPFSRLNITFEEYSLIKALTVWHGAYYKLTEEGREKCRRQRNIIIDCLSKLCQTNGGGEHRVGELLMSMNYMMESVQKLTKSYVLITFFDVLNCDSMLHEMLTFKY